MRNSECWAGAEYNFTVNEKRKMKLQITKSTQVTKLTNKKNQKRERNQERETEGNERLISRGAYERSPTEHHRQ